MTHELDNIIFKSLNSIHNSLAISNKTAIKFFSDVSTLSDFYLPENKNTPTQENFDDLYEITDLNGICGLLIKNLPNFEINGWESIMNIPCLEMIFDMNNINNIENINNYEVNNIIELLNITDINDILSLVELTKPGPFNNRTIELGNYYCIRANNTNSNTNNDNITTTSIDNANYSNTIASMCGERLKIPKYTEISAVCTHPDHLGNKYATGIIRYLEFI